VSRRFWPEGNAPLAHNIDIMRKAAVAVVELVLFALTIAATISSKPERSWRFLSLWLVAMILLSPTAHGHYLILASVPFAAIADAARQGKVAPRAIYAAIVSYLLAFSNYPLTFLQHYHWDGGVVFHAATEYCFAAAAFAYLAAYWFAGTRREMTANGRAAEIPAAAIRPLATHC
jgi:hypothetical protein